LSQCGEKCWPIFLKQLSFWDFKLIILLGVKTLEIFNKGANLQIKLGTISDQLLNNKRYKMLSIYHPSPIAPYNHKKNIEIFNSIKKELSILL
jgi:uracil-DNA glycosylase